MSKEDIIRALKDPDFLASLSPADRALLPADPVAGFQLTDEELTEVAGGRPPTSKTCVVTSVGVTRCCWG